MKKLIVSLFCIALFTISCKEERISLDINDIRIVKVYGCEYIYTVTWGGAKVYSHLGNCSNKIHCYNNQDK